MAVEYIIVKVKGKDVKIPKAEIDNFMKNLQVSKKEAIYTWLCDYGYMDNQEEKQLTEKAKATKLPNAKADKERKKSEPKPKKVSDEKKEVFSTIVEALKSKFGENVEIANENKLIFVKIDEKVLKIDLIEQRPKK